MDGRVDLARIVAATRGLSDFDVLCLQEAARGPSLPVGRVWRHPSPWPAEPRLPCMQRVLAEAAAESDVGPLRAMTTHLEYGMRRWTITRCRRNWSEGAGK